MTNKWTIAFILVIMLGSILIQLPLYDRHLAFNDEGYILNTAEQISEGAVLYRDKPGYVFPGLFYLLALLYKIFGVSFVLSRVAMAVAFSAMCLLVFLICRQMTAEWIAFCTALAFVLHKAWAFPTWNIIGYATFSIFLLSVAAYFLLLYNSTQRLLYVFLCGLFVAVGTIFRQDYSGVVAFGFFFLLLILPVLTRRSAENGASTPPPQLKVVSIYILSGAIVAIPVLAYFAAVGALPDMFLNTFWAPLTAETKRETTRLIPLFPLFSQDPFLRENIFEYLPSFQVELAIETFAGRRQMGYLFTDTPVWDFLTKLVHYSPYIVVILTAGVLGVRYANKTFGTISKNVSVLLAYSVSLILTQHRPYNLSHLMQMYAPTLILLGFLVDTLYRRLVARKALKYVLSVFLALAAIFYVGETIWATNYMAGLYSVKIPGPRANIYLKPEDARVWPGAIEYIKNVTSPDEPIFVMPYHSIFYFFAERNNPTKYDILWEVKTYASRDEEILDALDTQGVRYIVYSPTQPADWGRIEEFAPELMERIRSKYSVDKVFGNPKFGLSFIVLKRDQD